MVTQRFALLPSRLVIGFGFGAHGYAKVARGPEQFARILETRTTELAAANGSGVRPAFRRRGAQGCAHPTMPA